MQRIFTVLMMLMLAATFTFANGEGETAGAQKTADLVYVNWEEGVAYTHLAQAVLEDKMGYEVTITAADVAPGYAAIAQGDKDAFMETWLPVLHKSYIEKYSNQIVDLGHVFEGTESGLVIPKYMVDAGISSISDLLKPEAQEKLDKTITGIDAGAGVMITTEEEVMPAYGLTDAGYKLLPSSGPAMMASLKDAIANKEWIVVTGWKPHSMFGYWDLAFLEQDKDQVWGVGNIHIFGRKNITEDKPELAQFLGNMSMTNSELGSLMVYINESNLDTLEAARAWMNENEDVVADWIP
ncbi:glycine betaine ABC transporter substrate-binding protein [Marispirochaeta aestuarii]|uniref:glycine betaine ABC transporter substrate-binding protein n=1 Tax=Marispirochaeta aestuarii TaxID=1963862 RepID=UPI0029C95FA1|nr:glycine betaine ABC transporter substrate-binding protein [Marispirochaeta aestuarii]